MLGYDTQAIFRRKVPARAAEEKPADPKTGYSKELTIKVILTGAASLGPIGEELVITTGLAGRDPIIIPIVGYIRP